MSLFGAVERRFWTRRTVLAGALGLGCWLVTLPLCEVGLLWAVAVVSLVRLLPVWVFVRGWRGLWLAVAMPFPVALVEAAYLERSAWLPGEWARALSGPTEFLMVVSGVLLVSLGVTGWCVGAARRADTSEDLRMVGNVLFGLTAGAILVSYPPLSMAVLHWVAEPAALIGFAACAGVEDQ